MSLTKSKKNVYSWCSHTWNPVKGQCPYDCAYCSIKRDTKNQRKPRLIKKELVPLGGYKKIFVGSAIDMFSPDIKSDQIRSVLSHCRKYPKNVYIFQSKNPKRFKEFLSKYPEHCIFGTTIETDKKYICEKYSKAPEPFERIIELKGIRREYRTFISIEPIMLFSIDRFIKIIEHARPTWVNIGADRKNNHLPEANKKYIQHLIREISLFTEVNIKSNLEKFGIVREKKQR